jgi:arsenite-transporting ATPase
MRIVLYTGKGGVGKTCVSAAAALAAGKAGQRTVILSSDRAHSLGDCFGLELGLDPTPVAPNVEALETDPGTEIDRHWSEIQDYMRALMTSQGVDRLLAEEIAMIPGLEEGSTLLRLRDLAESGDYDALIVDCAPTGATLRLLSLPDAFSWFMRRIFPLERATVKVLRPTAGRLLPFPLPEDRFYASLESLYRRVLEVHELLTNPETSGVRLVTIPEQMAVEETKRAYAEFSLYALCVEEVIINRVLPDQVTDPYLDAMKASQRRWTEAIERDFAPLRITQAHLLPEELVGIERLEEFAGALFDGADPMQPLRAEPPVRIEERDGACRMTMALQFASREDVELIQRRDELVIEIGSSRRNLLLPRALAKMRAIRARVKDGALIIDFAKTTGPATDSA